MTMNVDCFPPQSCATIYIDGSATADTKDGGAGVLINGTTGRTETVCEPVEQHCTNYKAEEEAKLQAPHLLKMHQNIAPKLES